MSKKKTDVVVVVVAVTFGVVPGRVSVRIGITGVVDGTAAAVVV